MSHINWNLTEKSLFGVQKDMMDLYLLFFKEEQIMINQQQDASQYLLYLCDSNVPIIEELKP